MTQCPSVHQTSTHNENRHVGIFLDDGSVCHNFNRRAIQENEIIFLTELFNQLFMSPICKSSAGLGGITPTGSKSTPSAVPSLRMSESISASWPPK